MRQIVKQITITMLDKNQHKTDYTLLQEIVDTPFILLLEQLQRITLFLEQSQEGADTLPRQEYTKLTNEMQNTRTHYNPLSTSTDYAINADGVPELITRPALKAKL